MSIISRILLNVIRRINTDPRIADALAGSDPTVGLLANGSLDDQKLDEAGNLVIANWYTLWSGNDQINGVDFNVHTPGGKAVGLTKVDGEYLTTVYSGGQPECECSPWVRVLPGEQINFEFWTAGTPGFYRIENGTLEKDIIPQTPVGGIFSAEYFKVQGSFVVPADCYHVRIYLIAPALAGTAYFDDVRMWTVIQ